MKIVFSFISIWFLVGASFGATALSLQQAKDRVGQSPRIAASQAYVEEAKSGERISTGAFYPTLTFKETFARTNDPVGVFGAKLRQGEFTAMDLALPSLNRPDSVSAWATRIEVAQPILHSTTDWRNLEASRRKEEAAKYRHEHRILEARLAVTQLYYSSAALSERERIVGEGTDLLEKLEKSYQLMSAPTAATTTNFLISQSVRLSLTAQKRGLNASESDAKRNLTALLGLPSEEEVVLTDPLPAVSETSAPTDAQSPLVKRPDVKASEAEAESARAELSASKGDWGPTLDAVGGYSLYTGKWTDFEGAYDVGLLLSWPIFQGARAGRIDGARARLTGARELARSTRLEADSGLKNAQADLAARTEEYQMIQSAESKASEAFKLAKKRYAEGILSLFDYSQSIQNWVAIRQELVEAQRRAADAQTQLQFERGAL